MQIATEKKYRIVLSRNPGFFWLIIKTEPSAHSEYRSGINRVWGHIATYTPLAVRKKEELLLALGLWLTSPTVIPVSHAE